MRRKKGISVSGDAGGSLVVGGAGRPKAAFVGSTPGATIREVLVGNYLLAVAGTRNRGFNVVKGGIEILDLRTITKGCHGITHTNLCTKKDNIYHALNALRENSPTARGRFNAISALEANIHRIMVQFYAKHAIPDITKVSSAKRVA